MTDEELDDALRSLKSMCVRINATTMRGYSLVSEKYGLTPEQLRDRITLRRKQKYRDYMRAYMRRRRGSKRS